MYKLGLSISVVMLAAAAFWATILTAPRTTEAARPATMDLVEILRTAPKDAPIQDASVIACTYVLTEGHRCN